MGLGLSKVDARVYIFLANAGPQVIEKVVGALEFNEAVVQRSLEFLRRKRIVVASYEGPVWFNALPFDEALRLLADEHLKEAKVVEQKKFDLLSKWQRLIADSKG